MKETKIKLSFVNKGEAFILPGLTVGGQDELLEAIVELEKKYGRDTEKYAKEVQKIALLKLLQIVDKNVTIDDINNMHPSDYAYLTSIVWEKGRELKGESLDFRKTK
jgi:hypothetical protein